jgi:hypothetical protein
MNDSHDDELLRLIRASFGPAPDAPPRRDLWPEVVARLRHRPRLSRLDQALIGILVAGLLLTPQQVILLLSCL